jgi:alpha/beta superfamily hydrolase
MGAMGGDTSRQPLTIHTADGVVLEAERASSADPSRASVVLCHPHPRYGGTMRSIVISALFESLPRTGYTVLRFNFRGVERSTGAHDEGQGELLDVQAAIDAAAGARTRDEPLVLAGWSFGADMTLAAHDERLRAWIGIAPPLRFRDDFGAVAHDARPKLLVLGQHDEFRDPASVIAETADWNATEVDVIAGASHFFMGRTDRVVDAVEAFVARVAGSGN